MRDWYLFDAGWVFFAAWSAVVAVVSAAAFGRDLFPAKTPAASSVSADDARVFGRI